MYSNYSILAFNMLNCSHIIKDVFTFRIILFVQQKMTRFIIQQRYMLSIMYCLHHSCWCPGNLMNQGIRKHGIDQISRNTPFLVSTELRYCILHPLTEYSYFVILISNKFDLSSLGMKLTVNITSLKCIKIGQFSLNCFSKFSKQTPIEIVCQTYTEKQF